MPALPAKRHHTTPHHTTPHDARFTTGNPFVWSPRTTHWSFVRRAIHFYLLRTTTAVHLSPFRVLFGPPFAISGPSQNSSKQQHNSKTQKRKKKKKKKNTQLMTMRAVSCAFTTLPVWHKNKTKRQLQQPKKKTPKPKNQKPNNTHAKTQKLKNSKTQLEKKKKKTHRLFSLLLTSNPLQIMYVSQLHWLCSFVWG